MVMKNPVHPASEAGLDYVGCSPYRVPVAWLKAGRTGCGMADSV